MVQGFRPPSVVLDGPAHESHSDPQSRPGEVSDVSAQVESISNRVCVEVVVEEFPRLEAQEDFSQVENTQPVRLGRRLILVPRHTTFREGPARVHCNNC